MHILDIAQNSIRGEASLIEIEVNEYVQEDILEIIIKDNGRGMDNEMLTHVIDPYTTTRTTRKIGMGLPLLKHSAEQAGGYLMIDSKLEEGTIVSVRFKHSHIDRPPMGDLAGTIVLLVAANPEIEFKYIHQLNDNKYEFNTKEIKEVLEDVKINDPKIRGFLKEMIVENLNELYVL